MNVELLVSLVSEHKELYDKFVWFWQACKYLLSSSEWQASVRSVKLRSATLCTGVFLFYIKRHLMSGNEFACSLGSSSAKIAWVWTRKTRWKTLANNARRYSSRCPGGGRGGWFAWFVRSSSNLEDDLRDCRVSQTGEEYGRTFLLHLKITFTDWFIIIFVTELIGPHSTLLW